MRSSPADAVILDVMMPGVDGLEVCRRMRAAGDRTPVLMLTARDAIDDRVLGLDVGADDYLVKPFALRELQARLRALLRRIRRRRRRRRDAAVRRPGARSGCPRGLSRRPPGRAVQDRVPAARAVHEAPAPGADAFDDLRERLGLRLRPHLQRPRASTSATCAARPRRAASRACCTPCAASATSCETDAAGRDAAAPTHQRSSPPRRSRSLWRSR